MKLNLGCGPVETHKEGYVNVDKDFNLSPSTVWDVRTGLGFWLSDSADEICCENLFDSLEKHEGVALIREIWRVLKPGGRFVFHQGDVAVNPDMCFGWPFFKSPWTRHDFCHYTIGEGAYEKWKKPWNLPGFKLIKIEHNDNGIMIGEMQKP